ncbi:TIGR01777 family oxidoreductase [Shewanella sp. Isolate11]|uniref:TIGR01777 family oxidoreductase n=1 Tax=Shewanella sp. Isolate11 TaxID=2908530 RepID=UPI001EFD30B8|nr:TIGR01777 family oxidoreductase [Shewanella sp. Isolate11]MCG9696316.1 TIGR01777 family oxidoreductase [Shewanella sp. Isolate11]
MKILITGGTGFIGRQLVKALSPANELTLLTRSAGKAHLELGQQHKLLGNLSALNSLDAFDAVINLAGEPIADKRWSLAHKQVICYSRWDITARLSQLFKASKNPPSVFISGSAIGIYGNHDSQTPLDEHFNLAHFHDTDDKEKFPHSVCSRWEELALEAEPYTRVCIIRIGLVLGLNGGAMKKMLLPFKLGVGGIVGSGEQGMSWVHQQDLIQIILFLLENTQCQGIYNATAPHPVSNKKFTQSLGKVLNRPTLLPIPASVLSIALGELSELLLEGQYVYPKRLQAAGYQFKFTDLDNAFNELFNRD